MGSVLRRAAAAVIAASVLVLTACSAGTFATSDASLAGAATADVNDFDFASLDVDYTLSRADDGTSRLLVEERFVAVFPDYDQNRGMRRLVPDTYLGVPLAPEFVSITDGDGRPRPAEVEHEDGVFSMTSRADDFVHGEQTYVFTYTLENVTRFFEDTGVDEFYWNVNGIEWPQPFGRVTATVHVADDLASALTGAIAGTKGRTSPVRSRPVRERRPRPRSSRRRESCSRIRR